MSGRVEARWLYTFQALAIRLVPPLAAWPRTYRETISPGSVWKTCFSEVYAGVPMGFVLVCERRSVMCVRTAPLGSCIPRVGPMCDSTPTYEIAFSRGPGYSGRPRRTKNPRPECKIRACLCSSLENDGRGKVVGESRPRGRFWLLNRSTADLTSSMSDSVRW